jgi:photosystem II stability/assembly factor-like uncharacterized protein
MDCAKPIALAIALVLVLGAAIAPGSAEAAPALEWSAPVAFDSGGTPTAVSCASESLCVAVDRGGLAFSKSEPTASLPEWKKAEIDLGQSLNAVSCAPGGPCVAVDGRGDAFASVDAGASKWSSPASTHDGGNALTGVSCPTASLCVAVDEEGNVLTSTNPGAGAWALASAHPGDHPTAVSCSSASLCVIVDSAGEVLTSTEPTGGAPAWHTLKIDSTELLAVSCATSGTCVAVDAGGSSLASADPTASPPTWSATPIDGERLTAVSCAASGLCVAVDGAGNVLASDDPATPIPAWSLSNRDPTPLAGISCMPGGLCMAVDEAGRSIAGRVQPPQATTLTPTAVTASSATLAGAVDPNDAVLGACSFEYGGAGGPYTQSLPCAVLPVPTGGIQDVSAQVSGLSANTTYEYRVRASSPAGVGVGLGQLFTTAISTQVALVHPSPSITGTPANGQLLTCHAGLPAGASAQLSYAWLRDLIPIPGATGSTYTVKGQDTGHHLQCQVTATDGGGSASARSAFVTIPVGGVPAAAGETAVGAAVFKDGRASVPIACSALASGGCGVALRLTAVETLSNGRVVALAARAKHLARRSAATVRHVTITLASVRVRLAAGAHTTVTATLSKTAKRLLASKRRFSAYAYVTGTVIGVIEAQLSRQLLMLSSASHSASTHAARRR